MVASVWTQPNPKYKLGEPILSVEDLKAAGSIFVSLHDYFMAQSAKGAIGISAKVVASYFQSDGELTFTIAFSDLYDLFNKDGLDVSLLRRWTLRMKKMAVEGDHNVGFLDPMLFSTTGIQYQTKALIAKIENVMKHDCVLGAYNTGGHWVLVIITMKWNVVWYLDSAHIAPKRKFKDVQQVVNWAYTGHMDKKMKHMKPKPKTKPRPNHRTDMACARQPAGSMWCGFYVAMNLMDLLGDLTLICKVVDYKPTKTFDEVALNMVQGMLVEFIVTEIIDPKGDFYDGQANAV
ncbi:unnamed protein product [Urochloa humidicola]